MSVSNISEFVSYSPKTVEGQVTDERTVKPTTSQADKSKTETASSPQQVVSPSSSEAESSAHEERDSVLEQLRSVNEQFPLKSTSLIFEFDDANDPLVVKVVDKDSGEVIREIPPKELREIAQALSDIADNLNSGSGILFDAQS